AESESVEIVYLRPTPGPGTQAGGASSHINGFINAALGLGARVSVLSNDQIAGLDEAKAPLKIIWPKPIGTTRAAFDIYNNLLFTHDAVREIQLKQPAFIYQRYSRFSWAGVEASLKTGLPLFLEYNGSEVWVGRYWDRVGRLGLLERYERLNLKAAARIFVVSEVERRNLLRAGVEDEKIVVNPNGVDADRFRPNIGGERVRRELQVEADETLVGFVGTFGPWHGVLALAEAIKLLPERARVRFLMVGSGSLRSEVERTLREAGALERVILTGSVEHERVPALLDACDVLVSPHVPLEDGSEFFGSPTKLFEYMAMGRGIVASRLGQIGDVLKHEETALLVEPGNVRELSEAIMRLANSPDLRERLGAAARREAVAHHTWAHNARRVLDAYQKQNTGVRSQESE
nr:glycosyltransferase family 4 protein [Acidobacteriota bacterium]